MHAPAPTGPSTRSAWRSACSPFERAPGFAGAARQLAERQSSMRHTGSGPRSASGPSPPVHSMSPSHSSRSAPSCVAQPHQHFGELEVQLGQRRRVAAAERRLHRQRQVLARAVEVLPLRRQPRQAAPRLHLGPAIAARRRQLERVAQHRLRRHHVAAIAQHQRQLERHANLRQLVAGALGQRLPPALERRAIPAHRRVVVEALARDVAGALEQRHARGLAAR